MTLRERNLMFTLLGVVGVVVAAIVFVQWFWSPYQDASRSIDALEEEVAKKTQQIAALQKDQKRLEKYKILSLPSNPDQAAPQYYEFLMKSLRSCGLTDILLQGPPPGKLKMPATQTKKAPGHLALEFSVRAHGDIGNLVKALASLKSAPIAHRVKSLSLAPAEASGKDTSKLNIQMTIEALIVNKAMPSNPFLSSADPVLGIVDGTAGLRRGPIGLAVGLSVGPWFAMEKAIRQDLDKEAIAQRKYEDIKLRDMFAGAKPLPPEKETPMREDEFDMRRYVKLVQLVSSDNEAYLRNLIVRGRDQKLHPKKLGYQYFVVMNETREVQLVKGKALKVDQRELYFQVGEEVYKMHIGESLADAMVRRPLNEDELEELELTALYDEDFANEQQAKSGTKTKGGKGMPTKGKMKTKARN